MKIIILYASETGKNLELAFFLANKLKKQHQVTVKEISTSLTINWPDYDLIIINPRTDGAGDLAVEETDCYDLLNHLKLTTSKYWVAGIGDRGFGNDFAQAVITFDQQLARTGAQRLAPPLQIDYQLDPPAKQKICQILNTTIKDDLDDHTA